MKKFLKITAIVVVILLGTIIALPFIFKGKIVELVKKEANKQLTATVNFDNDVKLSLFKNFPQFTIELKNFSIADSTDADTLVSVQRFAATLNIMSVISGDKIEIGSILLDNPHIYAKVRKDGKANWDIMKPATDTTTTAETPADTSSSFKLGLKKLEIINGRIVYDDQQGGIYSALEGLNHTLSGDFTSDLFTLQTQTDVQAVTVGMDGVNYLNKVKATLKADLEADMKQFKFTFKENELQLNELFAGFDGFVAMPGDDIEMDLKFAAKKTDFKNILSLIPAVFTQDFANVKTSGKLGLDGSLKGIYNEKSLPAFNINLMIDNGMFQYPGMPADMRSIFVNLNVTNPDGVIDNTVIDLKKFDFVLANEPFSAKLFAKNPTTDPYVDMSVKGKVDLAQVGKLAPLEKGTTISGIIAADMSAKGRVSTLEKGNYEDFNAAGSIGATNVVYDTDSLPKTTITNAQLNFNSKTVELPVFAATLGNSDVNMKGSLSNFFGYFMGNGTLKGNLDLKSNLFDANQYLTGETNGTETAPAPTDTVPLTVVEIPKNIDFTFSMAINRFLYDNLELNNMGGVAKVAEGILVLNDVRTDIFGGNVKMNGSYSTVNPIKPETKLNFTVTNIDAGQAFKYMNTVQKLAPVAQYINGNISANFDLNTLLGGDMMPVLSSLTSSGKLEIPKAGLDGYPPMVKLSNTLKVDKLKTVDLNKILLMFKIADGRISIEPFKTTVSGINMLVSGSSGLDQSLDYDIKLDIPRSMFGSGANSALNSMLAEVGKQGVELKPSEVINVNALIGGFTTNPIIKTSLKDIAKNTLDDVKDAVKQKLNEEKDKAIDKADAELQKRIDAAKAAGDKLIADAQKKADALKAEARTQADAIVAEANKQADEKVKLAGSNPIAKAAAQKVADKLKADARTKADKAVAEADTKADGIVNEARKQADQLVKDAEAGKSSTLGR
jgi:hypothetical protein